MVNKATPFEVPDVVPLPDVIGAQKSLDTGEVTGMNICSLEKWNNLANFSYDLLSSRVSGAEKERGDAWQALGDSKRSRGWVRYFSRENML
jgi:hypothetical protein